MLNYQAFMMEYMMMAFVSLFTIPREGWTKKYVTTRTSI